MLRVVGQFGLMCCWLINDVLSQVFSVRNGSERLVKGNNDLNEYICQIVENVQEMVMIMNQMVEFVKFNFEMVFVVDKFFMVVSSVVIQGGEVMDMVIKMMDDIVYSM